MKAVQITRYAKAPALAVREIPVPAIGPDEVLVRVSAAAVNPVDLMNATGEIRLIFDYPKPFTLGNECAGEVAEVGSNVSGFAPGDAVYARLPAKRLGAFADYVAVDCAALAHAPRGLSADLAAAVPLAALTAYQAITEALGLKAGDSLLIAGASGSFGQIAIPLAKALGLTVYASGNARGRDAALAAGADAYFDYRKQDYTRELSNVDGAIDAVGAAEFARALSVVRRGGTLASLRCGPNRTFADSIGATGVKRLLFSLAGKKLDRAAAAQGKAYRFVFVRADGEQLARITKIVETARIAPKTDPREFSLDDAAEALQVVARGEGAGKILLHPAR